MKNCLYKIGISTVVKCVPRWMEVKAVLRYIVGINALTNKSTQPEWCDTTSLAQPIIFTVQNLM
jgi:hypothetical protein